MVDFAWFNVPIPGGCSDSSPARSGFDMRVNDRRKFHGVFSVPQTNHKAIVHGRFKHHNRKVVGTLRLKGNFSGGCIDADTGLLGWVRPPRRRLGGAPLSARDDYLVVSLDARGSCLLEAPSKLR